MISSVRRFDNSSTSSGTVGETPRVSRNGPIEMLYRYRFRTCSQIIEAEVKICELLKVDDLTGQRLDHRFS